MSEHAPVPIGKQRTGRRRNSSFIRLVSAICLALFLLASCGSQTTIHILLIGNSFTFFNDGIDKQLEGLAPSAAATRIAVGGYRLEDHWNGGDALQTIRKGGWDYVVLQEQSQTPVSDPTTFFTAVREFDAEIRKSGAATVLLMTWERPDSVQYGITTDRLAAAYDSIGAELGIKVAPAGLAFARSLQERPDLVLNSQDGHPTIYGIYLAACVLYGTLFGKSPLGNAYVDRSIPAEIRDYLQQVAAESLGY